MRVNKKIKIKKSSKRFGNWANWFLISKDFRKECVYLLLNENMSHFVVLVLNYQKITLIKVKASLEC